MTWYRDGSINLTAGSNVVTGTGTAWLNLVLAGEGLDAPDGRVYEVDEVVNNGHLRLTSNYLGATAAGAAYQIIPNASMTKLLAKRVSDLLSNYELELPKAFQRANHTGEQAIGTVAGLQDELESKVNKDGTKVLSDNNYTNDERVKLANIQALATKNLADAVLMERSNHTGGFNGFGTANLMRNHDALPLTAPPSAYFGKGSFVGFAMGVEVGIPGMSYGIGRVDAHWGDPTSGYGVMRSFEGGGGRRFTSYAVDANTWSDWFETSKRSNLQGMQGMDTIEGLGDALDTVMRVRRLEEATAVGFLDQMWHLGPGYYRNDLVNPITQIYSSGMFSKVADTWMYVSADRATGAPKFLAGTYPDIAAGTWKVFDFGSAAARNAQSSVTDMTADSLMTVGAFGLGKLNAASAINLNDYSQFPTGVSHKYLNGAINGPYSDFYGYLTVEKVDNSYLIQTVKSTTTGTTYRRTIGGATGPWNIVHDASTVVGGMAGGSIIETGTNSNGTYTKFADGTLICAFTKLIGVAVPAGNAYSPPLDFAATFVSTEYIHLQGVFYTGAGATGYQLYGLTYGYDNGGKVISSMLNTGCTPSTSHPGFTIGQYGATSVRVSAFAKGRWK